MPQPICTCLDSDEDRTPIRVELGGARSNRRATPRLVSNHNHGGRHARTLDRCSPRRCESLRRPRTYCWSGRVAAAPELAATRRPLREAKRQPLIEDCDVRPRDCVPMHGRVRACSRATAQQTATTAAGLELGSDDGLDGTIGFDGTRSRGAAHRDDSFSSRAGGQRAIAMATEQSRPATSVA